MEDNQEFGLEEGCIESHAPVKSEILKACFMDIKDLEFAGMPDGYANCNMARMQGSQYLMNTCDNRFFVDIDSLTSKKADIGYDISDLVNCFINREYMLVERLFGEIVILRDLQYIGKIEFQAKEVYCKNKAVIYGRYAQQVGKTVYALDDDGSLYRIEWQDIKEGKYQKTLLESDVENIYVDKILGMAIVDTVGILYLDNEVEVDLTKVNTEAK